AEAIANLSATLRNQSLDELVGEDVRQHERTLRLLRSAVAVLLALTVCAVFAAFIALQARKTADRVAQGQKTNAVAQANESRSRRLAVASLNEAADSDLRILLAAEAVRSHPTAEAETALRQSLFVSMKPVLTLPGPEGPVNYAIFSPDGTKTLAFGDAAPRLADGSTGAILRELRNGTNPVYHASFSPNGRRICTTSADGKARLWEVETGQALMEFPHENIVGAFLSSDESRLLTLGTGDLILWNAATGEKIAAQECLAVAHLHPHYPEVAFSPDGSRAALCGRTDPIIIETKTGQQLMRLEGHARTPRSVDYSPDGQWLITTGEDGTIRRWRSATGQSVSTWKHDAPLVEARFSPDGKWVVARDDRHTILIWDITTGRRVAALDLQTSPQWPVIFEFGPNGTCLATGSLDSGTAEIWDLATATKLAELKSEQGTLQTLRFSPDSKRLIVAGYDTPVQIYACEMCGSPADLLKYAQTRVSRSLTPEERAKFLGE
ncbi:MAG TPA: hypothetical protein DCE44_00025, partial [Verrucomicrobiales bacterium]|nr:hypothetical protein [Verrucomicrobiales bacterium]